MERRSYEAKRFLFCSVVIEEVKRFSLIFLERSGLYGGWPILAEKFCLLGVSPFAEFRGVVSPVEVMCSHKEGTVIRTSTNLVKKDLGVRGIIFLASTRGK